MNLLRLCLLLPLLPGAGCSGNAPPAPASASVGYAAMARGRIDVEGGLLHLDFGREGRLTSLAVQEGDRVARDQLLASLDPVPARLQLEAAEAAVAQARAQREQIGGRLETAHQLVQRLAQAAEAGAADDQAADAAAATVRTLGAEQAAADAAVAMAVQKRDEARYELGLRSLRSPVAADVVSISTQAGASVSPAAGPLFTLLPLTPLIVRAELSESFLDSVTVDMPALVSPDGADPARGYRAHVQRIGQVVGPAVLQEDAQQASLHTVSCILVFDPPAPPGLRVGQRVLVSFGGPAAGTKGR